MLGVVDRDDELELELDDDEDREDEDVVLAEVDEPDDVLTALPAAGPATPAI